MITVSPTLNPHLIKEIFEKEDLYNQIKDDLRIPIEHWQPLISPLTHYYLIPYVDLEIAGCIVCEMINSCMFNTHIILFEKFRGKIGLEIGKKCIEFMKNNTNATKLLAFTDSYKPWIKQYTLMLGYKPVATITNSWLKDGILGDQELLEYNINKLEKHL